MEKHGHFAVQLFGDIGEGLVFFGHSLEKALEWIAENASHPDIEDDRILVWQMQEGEEKKLVWHFSGWHFAHEVEDICPSGLPQGCLLGHTESLYSELSADL